MRNLIYLIIVLIILGSCQSKTSDNKQNSGIEAENTDEILSEELENTESSNNNYNKEDTSANIDLPASKYFEVINVTKAQYLESAKFEMELEIINNSNYKFSKFILSAVIHYTMKNSDYVCTSTVQYDAYNPRSVENWEPNNIYKFYFVTPSWGSGGGCMDAQYNRTPEKIVLVLKPFTAISVDLETEDTFAMYDLLPLWKERQVKEGLR